MLKKLNLKHVLVLLFNNMKLKFNTCPLTQIARNENAIGNSSPVLSNVFYSNRTVDEVKSFGRKI